MINRKRRELAHSIDNLSEVDKNVLFISLLFKNIMMNKFIIILFYINQMFLYLYIQKKKLIESDFIQEVQKRELKRNSVDKGAAA